MSEQSLANSGVGNAPCPALAAPTSARSAAARRSAGRGDFVRNLSLAGLVGVAVLLFAQPAAILAWTANTFNSSSESLMVQLHNQARANAGLRALTVDSSLVTEARNRSKDMIDRNYFSHSIPPDGHSVFDELLAMGYCYSVAGENIGWNTYPDGSDTQAMFDSFMGSATHKANILGIDWTRIGVGAYQGSTDKKIWTVLFSVPCGSSPTPTPTPTPTRAPTPTPTPTPRLATPLPSTSTSVPGSTPGSTPDATPAAAASRTAFPTLPPGLEAPDAQFTPAYMSPHFSGPFGTPSSSPSPSPTPSPLPDGTTLRVIDPPALQGFFETIVGGVVGFFFGS